MSDTQQKRIDPNKVNQARKPRGPLFTKAEVLFAVFLAATVFLTAVWYLLPLVGAAGASFTPVRKRKGLLITLWCVAVLLTLMQIAPFVLRELGLSSIATTFDD